MVLVIINESESWKDRKICHICDEECNSKLENFEK